MKLQRILALSVLVLLSGCEALVPSPPVPATPNPDPSPSREVLVARYDIFSSGGSELLAQLEVWMDGSPEHPRIVLQAVQSLVYFDLNLALPDCFVFYRPQQEMPGWRGGPLAAGASVSFASRWDQISDSCLGQPATVLWNLASQHLGSRSKVSIPWDLPQ